MGQPSQPSPFPSPSVSALKARGAQFATRASSCLQSSLLSAGEGAAFGSAARRLLPLSSRAGAALGLAARRSLPSYFPPKPQRPARQTLALGQTKKTSALRLAEWRTGAQERPETAPQRRTEVPAATLSSPGEPRRPDRHFPESSVKRRSRQRPNRRSARRSAASAMSAAFAIARKARLEPECPALEVVLPVAARAVSALAAAGSTPVAATSPRRPAKKRSSAVAETPRTAAEAGATAVAGPLTPAEAKTPPSATRREPALAVPNREPAPAGSLRRAMERRPGPAC